MKTIDLRSDTVTLPTPAMMQAIASAQLGDDVFGEDPTVNKLEKLAAEITGKQAALLVASGTMGNLVSMLTHCGRGDEVILGDQSHTFYYEAGGISALGGIHPHTIPNQPDGTLKLADIDSAIRPFNDHFPQTRLICLENTQNRCGGVILSPEYMKAVSKLAKQNNLKIHLDGARIFNAAIALDIDVKQLVCDADSVMFCLSKGLACPVGSIICGPADFIKQARRNRKILGGGMRQAGIIAAAGIVALEQMTDRLSDDHKNARILAEGLARFGGLSIDLSKVQTNIIYFQFDEQTKNSEEIIKRATGKGILFLSVGPSRFRMVTHYGIEAGDIEITLALLKNIIDGL